ncbi:antitoxin [Aeromicrobium phragmitis]|uniref:Antitoxin n=1 Tax=Aeromicrobium phragmitis TaxID=2478914 RepID=A0A3L8PPE8_9ACTN|nr:antitoxin [Aeromicrobium phragmitis]RLV55882.1 antitoxin [Aeromicrobium phragmitis]
MGFLDKLTRRGDAKKRAGQMMQGREDDIDQAVDTVAGLADRATSGKYSSKIDEAAARLKKAAQDMDDDGKGDPPRR